MAQDVTPAGRAAGGARRMTDARRGELLARLVLCRSRLTPEQAADLRAVFPLIFAAHYDQVRQRLRRACPSDTAKDLLQDVFVALHDHILDNGFPDNLGGLIRTITVHRLIDHLRRDRRTPFSIGLPSSRNEPVKSAPDLARAVDLRALMATILPQIAPERREVLELVVVCGLTHEETARLLDLPVGTVKSDLAAAKRDLAALAKPLLPPSQRLVIR
jgi:RNA polymerase sigma-70 factor (ECF subfamily)